VAIIEQSSLEKYKDPDIMRVQQGFSDYLGAKVEIKHGKSGSEIIIDCTSTNIFAGILEKCGYIEG